MLKYIKQRSGIDCAVSALAMACALHYEDAAAGLVMLGAGIQMSLAEAIQPEGANDDIIKAWLRCNGWAWQEVTRNIWLKGSFHPVHPWPARPFASRHVCFVEATKG